MRIKMLLSMLALGTSAAFCSPAEVAGSSAALTISQNTQIPGETLKPGDYSITVVDTLADRMILRVDSKTGNRHTLFLAVPRKAAEAASASGPILWPTGLNKSVAMRGFSFENGRAVEFVYPKGEAAALAKENSAKVIAVDPESEGHSAAIKNLSKDEMQMVNLWMLSLTSTGVDGKTPAVLAQRFEGYPESASFPPAVAEVRPQAVTPAPVAVPAPVQVARLERPAIAATGEEQTTRVRPVRRVPVVAKLPKTAGSLATVWLAGLMAVFGAFAVRFGRSWAGKRMEA